MIASLIAASLVAGSSASPPARSVHRPVPCQAVPSLCLASDGNQPFRIREGAVPRVDNKMNAYRFDARPCRIIGNLDCPRHANRTLFRLGEPVQDTLLHAFGLR